MMYNPFSLEQKTILITGASSGIGRQTAIECSMMGAKVIITGRNRERLNETLKLLEGEGHTIIEAELTDEYDVKKLVDDIPSLDGLVLNAGFNFTKLVPFIKDEDVQSIFSVNAMAPILLMRSLVKKKKMSKGSSVVFTSSISAKGISSPGNSLYSSTKGALTSFMKNAALELAAKKIRCNAVLPGMVETALKEAKSEITEEQWEANRQKYPLKRFGQPSDVAFAIIYLLSDASSWVTGSELIIDGGRSLD